MKTARIVLKKLARRHEDAVVRDPALLPAKLSARLARDLGRELGGGWTVEVTASSTSMPRSWDFANLTDLLVTAPGGRPSRVSIRVNVVVGTAYPPTLSEASANAALDGMTLTTRGAAPDEAIRTLIGEVAEQLGGR